MELHAVDIGIIVLYVIAVIALGWWISRKASKNIESYFLGGRSLPWYIIGISHGASGFDITGTMWFAMMFFTYGAKAIWILWIWPMFAMIFRMMYLGVWIRRSNVLTGAEWLRTRFGGRGGNLAHVSVVAFAVVTVVSFIGYAFQGIGKFAKVFFPWEGVPPETYATVILLVTSAYLIVGGMYSVILTDLVQYGLLLISAVGIGIIALAQTTPESISAVVPEGWKSMFFGWRLDLDWSNLIPAAGDKIADDGWSLFTIFTMALLLKGLLVSMAGPAPGYGIQHVLATRSPREAALESWWITVVAFFPRFILITAIVVLALVFYSGELSSMGGDVDFEQILPLVIHKFVPVGLTGIVVAGLVAAFMSTFDSTVNAGTAYVVNDIYKGYLVRDAGPRHYVWVSYACSLGVVGLGILFGYTTESIHEVTKWIVSALFGAYTAPNIIKWHWWRFNGYGFFAGMVSGVVAALGLRYTPLTPLQGFPIILVISTIASIVTTLRTPPERDDLLKEFYLSVRPWGFWKPVLEKLRAERPDVEPNRDARLDLFNCGIGIIWQTSIVAAAVFVILREWPSLIGSVVVLVVTSAILKWTWYDRLGPGDMHLVQDPKGPR